MMCNSLVEQVLSHFEDCGVVLIDPPAGKDEAGGAVRKVVRERHVDVKRRAWKIATRILCEMQISLAFPFLRCFIVREMNERRLRLYA